jgi:membrane-associated phospholipid phosphatase
MRFRPPPAMLFASFILLSTTAAAKSSRDYLDDLGNFALAPLHWDAGDWVRAGESVTAIAAAYSVDGRVRDHFVSGGVPAGRDPHEWRDAAPLLALTAGTYAFGRLRHDDGTASLGVDMAEATVLGVLGSTVLKVAAGRVRPNETSTRSAWRDGGDSFPSGHVTAAFAVAEVFADGMPTEQWGWRVLAYGLAGATAYARLDSNVHWLSDTVAGAALGIATGRFVSARSGTTEPRVSMSLAPLDHGAMLSFRVRTD